MKRGVKMTRPDRGEVKLRCILTVWVLAVTAVISLAFPAYPGWPAFMAGVCFFIMGGDPKRIPELFAGAFAGLLLACAFASALTALAPRIGIVPAFTLTLLPALGIIIVGGAWVPVALNNVTFAYMTVAMIDVRTVSESLPSRAVMLLAGGGALVGGAALFTKLLISAGQKKAEKDKTA